VGVGDRGEEVVDDESDILRGRLMGGEQGGGDE
jgi:hypothetical protein